MNDLIPLILVFILLLCMLNNAYLHSTGCYAKSEQPKQSKRPPRPKKQS